MVLQSDRQICRFWTVLALGAFLLPLLTGCREETPVSPNEKTAAPARFPGEDPHAHGGPVNPKGAK
jgi:hypothetical protein